MLSNLFGCEPVHGHGYCTIESFSVPSAIRAMVRINVLEWDSVRCGSQQTVLAEEECLDTKPPHTIHRCHS